MQQFYFKFLYSLRACLNLVVLGSLGLGISSQVLQAKTTAQLKPSQQIAQLLNDLETNHPQVVSNTIKTSQELLTKWQAIPALTYEQAVADLAKAYAATLDYDIRNNRYLSMASQVAYDLMLNCATYLVFAKQENHSSHWDKKCVPLLYLPYLLQFNRDYFQTLIFTGHYWHLHQASLQKKLMASQTSRYNFFQQCMLLVHNQSRAANLRLGFTFTTYSDKDLQQQGLYFALAQLLLAQGVNLVAP
ncbi:hypothetical protein [Psittacicella hinzii]|uniref:Uncharacterized protein n=1 Tax=Psittacicella hinzii TaxID=2028575 RepID=A0A3A1YNE6_9GAMM|nr:hypothetical protein [Psittacicella hinzii]RIY39682.1 hypothetical protein CKF58_01675 [Psittacicella hinzii]